MQTLIFFSSGQYDAQIRTHANLVLSPLLVTFRAAATGQASPASPWTGLDFEVRQFCLFFLQECGKLCRTFLEFQYIFLQKPFIPRGQFKNHMDYSRWVGVGWHFSKVGWPENILLLQP